MISDTILHRFDEEVTLAHLQHYLPHQNPLKDFIHHNTLEAFQELSFHEALETASTIFGYKTYTHLNEYRQLYEQGKINPAVLEKVIKEAKGKSAYDKWLKKLLEEDYDTTWYNRLGQLHQVWTQTYHLNIEKEIHSFLFRFTSSYIDQGIAIQKFPCTKKSFLEALRDLDENSLFSNIFVSKRVRKLLHEPQLSIEKLLHILVGDEVWYEQYLFDQQFAHAGWSGMVAVLEKHPESLLDKKKISLKDFILLELLLEIDALDRKFGESWKPLADALDHKITSLFAPIEKRELFEVYQLWQEAYEWTFYDQVLRGLQLAPSVSPLQKYNFQAIFCIDDRECSLRRYTEEFANAQTFGTAGFFNIEFYFQPEHGKFNTKSCPAPLNPKYLIKESEIKKHHHQKDAHFSNQSKNLFGGWLISQTMGFWSAVQLVWNIFKPSETPALVSAFRHMDKDSKLHYECNADHPKEVHHLQVGFTIEEMATRVEGLLKSIGLTDDFCELVYFMGHGASSVNNTHYAGYDCGACSGRAGSVNARLAAIMANNAEVRAILREKGIRIPDTTHFLGALHDTTRDEIYFYDEHRLPQTHQKAHENNKALYEKALAHNAKERSRRFLLVDNKLPAEKVHEIVKLRALSLFEPRPEWNHATNALCIVGRRASTKHLFLDRRSFLNSYDYSQDPEGTYLLGILKAVAPVCGGINLEYYFSKVDNYRLGAGSKLPHNVIGLVGVANGLDGDLRTGLPAQMLNIHDTLRLMVIVEHHPKVILDTIQKDKNTYQWFYNNWVHLVAIHPETKATYQFIKGDFFLYEPVNQSIPSTSNLEKILENSHENLPIYLIA